MRDVDIHTADLVARARARLAALMRRPRTLAHQRLAKLMPGVAARIDPAEAAAYEEAARGAFRAGTTLEAPRPLAPAPAAELPASTSGAARPVAPVSAPTASAAAPAAEPAREPAAAERPTRRHRRQAGETAPDFLLRTPTNVTPVADDFFEGLIRRIEGDR